MERPSNSIDLFELSQKYGQIHEEAVKIIIRQVWYHFSNIESALLTFIKN